jgi:AraC family transcriptional regulator, transcriptional activator of pobA
LGKKRKRKYQGQFKEDALFAFSPFEPFMFIPDDEFEGVVLNFHPDFYCIHQHQEEVSCRGVLFHNIFQLPYVMLGEYEKQTMDMLVQQINAEMKDPRLAQHEAIVCLMKLFLICGSRLKTQHQLEAQKAAAGNKDPQTIKDLRIQIENNFKTKHSASDYAELLSISPKALAKITKQHFNKTLSHIINERIVIEAKRELFLTNKPIKAIAYELGYEDEYYFSRFFKINADVSPQTYRDTVGYGRGTA